jgi:hypothetical protein
MLIIAILLFAIFNVFPISEFFLARFSIKKIFCRNCNLSNDIRNNADFLENFNYF